MSDGFNFEQFQAASASIVAATDQMVPLFRPAFNLLAGFEQAAIGAGMSPTAAAMFTMKLADRLGWPAIGDKP